MEREFRARMLEKFANDDKLEQLAQNKRRMKEVEHKKEVQRLWQERLKVFRVEQEKQEEERKRLIQDESWKEEVIRREKERLIRQNIGNLDGFLPKDLAKAMSGTTKEPRRTGYSEPFRLS